MEQLVNTVRQLFIQIENALYQLSDAQYCYKNSLMGGATIGQHVRHITELYQEMVTGYSTGEINYEKRQRNLLIEQHRDYAIAQMQEVPEQLNRADKKLLLASCYDTANNLVIETCFVRELIYNIEHTVHHQALIKIGFKSAFAIDLPDEFGVAASTLKYRAACVQ